MSKKLTPRADVTFRTYRKKSMATLRHAKRDALALAMLKKGYSAADVSAKTGISERHVSRMFRFDVKTPPKPVVKRAARKPRAAKPAAAIATPEVRSA